MVKRGVVSAMGVLTGSYLLEGIYYRDNASLLLAVVVLAVFSAILKPLLVFLALPFVVLTLGLGVLFINALLYLLVGRLVDGFDVDTFGAAFFGALIITFFNVLFSGWIARGPRGPRSPPGLGTRPSGKAPPRRPSRPVKAKDDVIDI